MLVRFSNELLNGGSQIEAWSKRRGSARDARAAYRPLPTADTFVVSFMRGGCPGASA